MMKTLPWVSAVLLAVGIAGVAPAASAQTRTARTRDLQVFTRNPALENVVRAGGTTVDTISTTTPTVQLRAGEFLAARNALGALPLDRSDLVRPIQPDTGGASGRTGGVRPTPVNRADGGMVLPFDLLMPSATGELIALRPVYLPMQRLRYDATEQAFLGKFFIALEDTLQRAASRSLESAIRLQFTSDGDAVEPSNVSVSHTNFPLVEVGVRARTVRDSLRIRIIPEFDLNGVDVWLGADPALAFQNRGARIQGLGVQTAVLAIGLVGPPLDRTVTVFLDSDRGTVEPSSVEIGPAGLVTARIRSAGVGPANVTVSSPDLVGDQIDLTFTWPILFLLAALLGGALGGWGRWVQQPKEERGSLAGAMGAGTLLGVLAAVIYYAIGVSLLHVDVGVERFNEGAVFAFAALAGLTGLKLIGSVKPKPA